MMSLSVLLEEPIRRPFPVELTGLLELAAEVVQKLVDAGHETYLVGGSIRDLVREQEPKDYDIATSALPEEVQALFRKTVPVGIQFGTVMVLWKGEGFEVTTFRADGRYLDGRRPEKVTFASVREDVERRDFTINGLLFDPTEQILLDYVGGLADMEHQLLRTIGDPFARFGEDRLRMLRAVRFASRLSFTLDDDTAQAIRQMASRIHEVSGERIQQELLKIVQGAYPHRGVSLLAETGLLAELFPLIPDVQECIHLMDLLEHDLQRDEVLGLAALLIGLSPAQAEELLRNFKFSREHIVNTRILLEKLPVWDDFLSFSVAQKKRLLREPFAENLLRFGLVVRTVRGLPLEPVHEAQRKMATWKDQMHPTPLFNGNDLQKMGYPPGPNFKEILTQLEDAQLEDRFEQKQQALDWLEESYPLETMTSNEGAGRRR